MLADANVADTCAGRTLIRTRNSEYHLDGLRCVAVRSARSGELLERHPAVGRALSGAFHFGEGGQIERIVPPNELPEVGDILWFSEGKVETELRTSPVREICLPAQRPLAPRQPP